MTPNENVIRFESFCQLCDKRLLVSIAESGLVWPVGNMINTRSGCCGAYVSRIARVVPNGTVLDQATYQKIVADNPLSTSTWAWHAKGGAKGGEIHVEHGPVRDTADPKVKLTDMTVRVVVPNAKSKRKKKN